MSPKKRRRTRKSGTVTKRAARIELKSVFLDRASGEPEVEIAFGFAQHGRYRIFVWDSAGANPRKIGEGVNTDSVPDRFLIGEPTSQLHNRIITWEGLITSVAGGSGERYAVTVLFAQDGANRPDGPFTQSGELKDVKAFYDAVRVVVT
jgi:hypothetical protein